MAIKTFAVSAQVNMDASKVKTVLVKANTERKARIFAEKKLKENFGAFHVTNMCVKEIK